MLAGALAAAPSWGASGGTGFGGSPPAGGQSGSAPPTTSVPIKPGNVTVTASAGGITLASRASALLRKQLSFQGQAPARAAGSTVEIERLGRETGWQWAPTVTATVGSDGSFATTWRTNHIGPFSIRAVLQSSSSHAAADSSATAPIVNVTVYRPSRATLYGPGFFGKKTACGMRLRRTTIGVANRTLKCGTPVAIYYRGRTTIVPVIDRGPFANGADWDLTEATGKAIGIPGTATIGAVSEPKR